MKKSSFYLNWVSFILGFFFGIFGVILALFAQTDRRDKVYSSLLGLGIGLAVSLVLLKYVPLKL